ncbi:hypothetical protein V2W45_1377592 [Cenococcum geophilum]
MERKEHKVYSKLFICAISLLLSNFMKSNEHVRPPCPRPCCRPLPASDAAAANSPARSSLNGAPDVLGPSPNLARKEHRARPCLACRPNCVRPSPQLSDSWLSSPFPRCRVLTSQTLTPFPTTLPAKFLSHISPCRRERESRMLRRRRSFRRFHLMEAMRKKNTIQKAQRFLTTSLKRKKRLQLPRPRSERWPSLMMSLKRNQRVPPKRMKNQTLKTKGRKRQMGMSRRHLPRRPSRERQKQLSLPSLKLRRSTMMRRIRHQKRPSLTRTLLVGGVAGLIELARRIWVDK